ncbi:hypothetical protein [Alteromonas gracilis]|uniref:hypothetical protein n=1 Tax=Alteromonas gracilis TaxID=1479524 RepID=UPI0037358164
MDTEFMAFDVWSNADGNVAAVLATKQFVDDQDAPYGFERHEIRIDAPNKRAALKGYREERNKMEKVL